MRFSTSALIAVLCAATISLGWSNGYQSISAYFTFWLLAALLFLISHHVVRQAWPVADPIDQSIRIAVVALAVVVGCVLVLGALKLLTVAAVLGVESILWAASWSLRETRPRGHDDGPNGAERSWTHSIAIGVGMALLAFAIAFAASHAPMTLYDSLSYHLFFAGRWVQDHAISIVPTPFSDEAQAYGPANGELFFAWLMLPFHGDLFARFGQMPFALLAAATLYGLARRLGAPRAGAIYPSLFLLLSRPVLEQAVGANVDLICATLFLITLYLGIVAIDRQQRRDWVLWGVAFGLYAGTKYLAVVYAPVLMVLAFTRTWRRQALWAAPGVAAFALPWYARNWFVAGSPLYPASVTLGGLTLARGAFDRTAMLNTVFHSTNARMLPAIAAHGLGPTLLLFWLPLVFVGGAVMLRRGWWPHGFVLAVPLLVFALCWFAIPVNVDSRFLMPAIAPALLPLAFLFEDRSTAWNRAVHIAVLAGMAWIVVGLDMDIPADLPWFMRGWLSLDGLISSPYRLWFGALALGTAAAWKWRPRDASWHAFAAVSLVVVPAVFLTIAAQRVCATAACDYLSTTPTYIRADVIAGWQWIAGQVRGSTVAYTGNNLPYPLSGPHLTNRVIYVNIDGRPRWKFHDYDRAYRSGRFQPMPPRLAVSSGELLAIPQPIGTALNALRPRYERMQGIRDAWIDNINRLNVTHVFIAVLSPYEIDYVWHDADGFPIEEQWAASDPQMFHLIYENSQVRVYRIDGANRSRV